jgi:hypothetical protein
MDMDSHVPSLTHLRDFARSRATGRPTHVAQDRQQVAAPANDRIFAFVYEKFLTSVIEFIDNGSRGNAMSRAVAGAPDRMRPSYEAAAKGMTRLLPDLRATSVKRRQRNVVVTDLDSVQLVSLRIHLQFELPDGRSLGALMYFSEKALTDTELALIDTAVALAVRKLDASAIPVVVMVREGAVRLIDNFRALEAGRVAFLRAESQAYMAEWKTSA